MIYVILGCYIVSGFCLLTGWSHLIFQSWLSPRSCPPCCLLIKTRLYRLPWICYTAVYKLTAAVFKLVWFWKSPSAVGNLHSRRDLTYFSGVPGLTPGYLFIHLFVHQYNDVCLTLAVSFGIF